jgi:hypothetical protein
MEKTETKTIKRSGNPFLSQGKGVLGYPWDLREKEVTALLASLDETKENPCLNAIKESSLMRKLGIRSYEYSHPEVGEKKANSKVRYLMIALSQHPSLVTKEMKETIGQKESLKKLYVERRFEIVKKPAGDVMILNHQDSEVTPLAKEEEIKIDIMENMLDKMQIILNNLSPRKIQVSSLGTLSKSLENLMKSYTMFKGEIGPRTFNQININNLNLQQKKELSLKMGQAKK